MTRQRSAVRTNTHHINTISYRLTRMVTWETPLGCEQSWSPDGQGMLAADPTGAHVDEVGLATIQGF